MSGDYSTQLDLGTYTNYGDSTDETGDDFMTVDDPTTTDASPTSSTPSSTGTSATSSTATSQNSTYASSGDASSSSDPTYAGIDDFLSQDGLSASGTNETTGLDQNNVITTDHVKHIVLGEGDTTIYSIPSKNDGGQVEIEGVSNTGYARVKPGDAGSVIVEMLDSTGKVVETVKVNYMQPTADFFIRGGTKLDLSAVADLPIASHIHWNDRPKDLAKTDAQDLDANKFYQLSKFRFVGDSSTFTLKGENTILDLRGDGTDGYGVTNISKVDKTHYNFDILVKNAKGESDTIHLKNVSTSTKINLFGGTLEGDVPEDIQTLFPKNYTPKEPVDARKQAQDKKIASVEQGLASLPPIGKLSRAESDALYKEMWQNFKNIIAFYNGNQTQINAVDGLAKMVARVAGNTKLQTQAGGNAIRPLIRNMVKLLSTRYPELLENACGLNASGALGSALIGETMSKDDVATFALLEAFSGADKKSIETQLDGLKSGSTMSDADWNKVKANGMALYNATITSATYTSYQKDKKAGNLTLIAPNDSSQSPTS